MERSRAGEPHSWMPLNRVQRPFGRWRQVFTLGLARPGGLRLPPCGLGGALGSGPRPETWQPTGCPIFPLAHRNSPGSHMVSSLRYGYNLAQVPSCCVSQQFGTSTTLGRTHQSCKAQKWTGLGMLSPQDCGDTSESSSSSLACSCSICCFKTLLARCGMCWAWLCATHGTFHVTRSSWNESGHQSVFAHGATPFSCVDVGLPASLAGFGCDWPLLKILLSP